jgi:(1->4)-alpha-D-glucan 1-alpha-D-glucosylmutase
VTGVLSDAEFQRRLERTVAPLVAPGRVNSLAQTLLKLTSPGVPDLYQGTELWDLSLVDPDNRRPVDYAHRRALLDRAAPDAPNGMETGEAKMFLIREALRVRHRYPASFGPGGTYTPLGASGAKANHVVAFLRGADVAAVVPRVVVGLRGDWGGTTLALPPGTWIDALTGASFPGDGDVPVADLLGGFAVALLTNG